MHTLLFLFFLLITTTTTPTNPLPSPQPSPASTTPEPNQAAIAAVGNQTTYTTSKALCWACWAESLQFLLAHNLVRGAHWELPLVWDSRLEAYARWWAGQRRADCRPMHSFPEGGFTLGENVFWGGGSGWPPDDAVRAWAEEEKYYSYGSNSCQAGQVCGHYTQIVWRSTRRLGCARVVCDDGGGVFMTCNYDPPGNYIGERPY